jgi:hypothetical protein
VVLTNLITGANIPLTSMFATELANTTKGTGGNATSLYRLFSSQITTPPTALTFISYVMEDVDTGELREGKFAVGGHPDDIAIARFQGQVFIDTVNGVAGTAYPRGTQEMPVNNLADAKSIADARGIRSYHLHTGGISLSVGVDHTRWTFEGDDPEDDIVTIVAGTDVASSSFEQVGIRGDLDGRIAARDCAIGVLGSGITTGVQGTFDNCAFRGSVIEVAPGGVLSSTRAFSDEILGIIFDLVSTAQTRVLLGEFTGIVSFVNASAGGQVIAVNANGARITTAASVGGSAVLLLAGLGLRTRNDTLTGFQVIDQLFDYEEFQQVRDGVVGRRLIDRTNAAQWTVKVFDTDAEATLRRTYNLRDGSLAAINDANPLPDLYIGELDPV